MFDPLRLDDWNEGIADRVVAGEIDGHGDHMGELVQGGKWSGRLVDGYVSAIVTNRR